MAQSNDTSETHGRTFTGSRSGSAGGGQHSSFMASKKSILHVHSHSSRVTTAQMKTSDKAPDLTGQSHINIQAVKKQKVAGKRAVSALAEALCRNEKASESQRNET